MEKQNTPANTDIGIHTNGHELKAKVGDFGWFSTLEIEVVDAKGPSSRMTFFLKPQVDADTVLEDLVWDILVARPNILRQIEARVAAIDGLHEKEEPA